MEAMNRADAETGSPAGGSMLQLSKGSGEEMSEFHETEPMPMEWTDEKHNLYLKSMEASFMNQLHDSMNLLSERFKNYNLSNIDSSLLRSNTDSPSGQFKVHQDGNWKKLSFKRPAADVSSDELLASPWIQHFRPVSKLSGMEHDNGRRIAASTGQVSVKGAISSASTRIVKPVLLCQSQLRHQAVGSNTGNLLNLFPFSCSS
ncbi:hypothetical protein CDL15_Pgr014547 [Punica granatum]|uniref:Cold-regulated protein 27-like n=1 Tax=Punica granatum TaxID=22663 RepID=A0A218WDC2_PUNGR|nr:hypothetical protein CDL15_Pgr014547 [Punica granatum]